MQTKGLIAATVAVATGLGILAVGLKREAPQWPSAAAEATPALPQVVPVPEVAMQASTPAPQPAAAQDPEPEKLVFSKDPRCLEMIKIAQFMSKAKQSGVPLEQAASSFLVDPMASLALHPHLTIEDMQAATIALYAQSSTNEGIIFVASECHSEGRLSANAVAAMPHN